MLRHTRVALLIVTLCAAGSTAAAQAAELPPEAARADSLMKAKDFAGAAKLYEQLVVKLPAVWGMWRGLALASYHNKDYPRSAAAFEKVAEITSLPRPLFNAGVAHALAGHDDVAFSFLTKAAASGKIPVSDFKSDTDLERLRKDKRFDAVIAAAEKSAQPPAA
jgi:tetratricopeptide (TPR) repeat protein